MGDLYEPPKGAVLRAHTENTGRDGAPIRLDGTPAAEQALEALRAMAARQVDAALSALRDGWAKVDTRMLSLLEDTQARELRETAEELAEALRLLEVLGRWVDDADDDPEPGLVPDPAGGASA